MRTDKQFIAWFHKRMIDLVYQGKIPSEVWEIFKDLVHEWETRND